MTDVALVLGRDGKIYLRAADGLEDWFELLEECMLTSKERRRALRCSHDGKPRDNNNITTSLDEWLAARQKILVKISNNVVAVNAVTRLFSFIIVAKTPLGCIADQPGSNAARRHVTAFHSFRDVSRTSYWTSLA
ncbi:hypothetical protein NQ318_015254 [Aromia moschata]|uniref:Uncharacterized protein n=1 Tax=Aromia moschata TaxID=1265417 RepID=A0AAV8YGY4_9CUCU|nr:hypothetical protein NQ318_015254 [Aromia moschata]